MSNTIVLSRREIAKIVGDEAAMLVSSIERACMEFGTHHRWTSEQVFTRAGVEILVEKLAESHKAEADLLREYAADFFKVVPVAVPVAVSAGVAMGIEREREARALVAPLSGGPARVRVEHNPLNGYMPEADL
jgi:phosphotransferase system  glucose/maltose/N-acetylglucosamine-specific IIC component